MRTRKELAWTARTRGYAALQQYQYFAGGPREDKMEVTRTKDLTCHLTLSIKDAMSGDMLDTASFAPISRPDMTSKKTLRGGCVCREERPGTGKSAKGEMVTRKISENRFWAKR